MAYRRLETLADIEAGTQALSAMDRRMPAILARAGAIPLRRREAGYQGLAEIVVSQMVSKASADAIWGRLAAVVESRPGVDLAGRVLTLGDEDCRAIGLSRGKERTLKAAAEAVCAGRIDLAHLCAMPAEEAVAALTAIKGIGPWTAEVYLLFCAGHADIFPAGDVALQNAVRHAFDLDERPDARQLSVIAAAWAPWRGVAARVLWAYYGQAVSRTVLPV